MVIFVVAVASPPSGFGAQTSLEGDRLNHVMRMVAEENSKLWQELSSMKALLFWSGN